MWCYRLQLKLFLIQHYMYTIHVYIKHNNSRLRVHMYKLVLP